MKVVWVSNIPIGEAGQHFYNQKKQGLWMDACMSEISKIKGLDLIVITSGETSNVETAYSDGITYYLLPGGNAITQYNGNSSKNIEIIKGLMVKIRPDIIHLWGTEGKIGEAIVNTGVQIPIVITMQGFMYTIAKHYLDGLTQKDMRKMITIRNFLKQDSLYKKQKNTLKQAAVEKKLLVRADSAIISNEWGEAIMNVISPQTPCDYVLLPMNNIFFDGRWKGNDDHSIICTAPYASFKGFHILLRALAIVKKDFPNVRLLVPGSFQSRATSFNGYLKRDGYVKYVYEEIDNNELTDNIFFLGQITQQQLKSYMEDTEVFCMPSAIENHASTLLEAMALGMPCIASDVGGVGEYVKHGENVIKYRFEEHELLARYICKLFKNSDLRRKLSHNARMTVSNMYKDYDISSQMNRIYQRLLSKSTCLK